MIVPFLLDTEIRFEALSDIPFLGSLCLKLSRQLVVAAFEVRKDTPVLRFPAIDLDSKVIILDFVSEDVVDVDNKFGSAI